MSVDITGDGPQITATGTGAAITLSVTTGSGGGDTDLIGSLVQVTPITLASPHPFTGFVPVGTPIELVGQTDPTENGSYTFPASGALVAADEELLVVGNANRDFVFSSMIVGATVWNGPHHLLVATNGVDVFLSFIPGQTVPVVDEVTDPFMDPEVGYTASPSLPAYATVVAVGVDGDSGIYLFPGNATPLIPFPVAAPAGVSAWSMRTKRMFANSPHQGVGWVRSDSEYALGTEVDDQVHDALTATQYALDPPAAWFEFDDDTVDTRAWSTPDPDELAAMPDMRALVWFERGTIQFNEIWTRTFDGGIGDEDSPEMAVYTPSAATSPELYLESVPTGGTEDEQDVRAAVDIEGVWALLRTYYPTTTTARAQIAVRWGGDETTGDGTQWRTLATQTRDAGIAYDTDEPWWLGLRFSGRIAWGELYDGADGTLVASPNAADWTTGLTFTDGQSNVWTTVSGTVTSSVPERVAALEAAPSTVDVVSNVTGPTILGRVTGSGDSEELTAAQARSLLAQNGVVLHAETLGSDTASKSYDVTGWAKIAVEYVGRSTRASAQDGLRCTFNGDTGNVYSTNAGSLSANLLLGSLPGALTNTDRIGMAEATFWLGSGVLKTGLGRSTNIGSTATVAQSAMQREFFSTITAAVTSVELSMANANMAAGSRIRIIGLETT